MRLSDFFSSRNIPRLNFSENEIKIMRALWLKNAPMSREEILGACLSEYWPLWGTPDDWICALLTREVIVRLENGKYDALVSFWEHRKYLKRRRLYELFCVKPVKFSTDFKLKEQDPWQITEYELRSLSRLVEKGRREMEARRA